MGSLRLFFGFEGKFLGIRYGESVSIISLSTGIDLIDSLNSLFRLSSHIQPVSPIYKSIFKYSSK